MVTAILINLPITQTYKASNFWDKIDNEQEFLHTKLNEIRNKRLWLDLWSGVTLEIPKDFAAIFQELAPIARAPRDYLEPTTRRSQP
jgi:hypothetical protein